MITRRRWRVLGLPLAVAVAVTGCSRSPGVVTAAGDDRFPDQTASDWVTYADHVAIVRATADRALPPDKDDQENGEGYIRRQVTLKPVKIMWSRPDASHPAPSGNFEWSGWGWSWQDGQRIPMAGDDQPRVEVGHTYLMALVWQPGIEDGGQVIAAHWDGLGADSTLPYDGGVIGQGENEGVVTTTASKASTSAGDPNYSLEDAMTGKTADDLLAALEHAIPEPRQQY